MLCRLLDKWWWCLFYLMQITDFILRRNLNSFHQSQICSDHQIAMKTRPNWARKVRELILFNVLCTVYCGRSCLSLESEGKEIMRGCVNFCCGQRATTGRETRGVLRGPRGPKKISLTQNNLKCHFSWWVPWQANRGPCSVGPCGLGLALALRPCQCSVR